MATSQLVFDILANDKASKVIEGVGDKTAEQAGKWDKWKTGATVAAAAVGAAMVKFGADSIGAYTESEQAAAQLDDAFARFPALADTNAEALRGLNEELAKKTRYDDDATSSGQAVLAQFGLTGQQITELTPLLQDYAAKTGKDLPTAAEDLGKAVLGQGRALKSIGLDLADTGSATGNLDQLMAGLRSQVGGFAETEGATAAGQSEILKNQFGELQETVGGALMPALQGLVDVGLRVVDWISNNTTLAAGLAIGLGVLTGAVMLAASWETIYTTAKTIGTAAQWAWNAAMTANPIGIIIMAIGALIAAIVWMATNWDTVREKGAQAWEWIKGAWSGAADWFSGIGDSIRGAFKGAFNWVAEKWNSTVGKLSWTIPDWVPGIGGNTLSVPKIPMLAKGGDVLSAGLAIVGEAGPELLQLPVGARVSPLNGRPAAGTGGPALHIEHYHAGTASSSEIADDWAWKTRGRA